MSALEVIQRNWCLVKNNEFKTNERSNYNCKFEVSDRFRQGSLFKEFSTVSTVSLYTAVSFIHDIYEFNKSFRNIEKLTLKWVHLKNAVEYIYIYIWIISTYSYPMSINIQWGDWNISWRSWRRISIIYELQYIYIGQKYMQFLAWIGEQASLPEDFQCQ